MNTNDLLMHSPLYLHNMRNDIKHSIIAKKDLKMNVQLIIAPLEDAKFINQDIYLLCIDA
jgi:hypothetical protein